MDMELSKETIALMRYGHGLFNITVALMFAYMARMGFRIRRTRIAGTPDNKFRKRHRKLGPVAAVLGLSGFGAGSTLIYLDKGHLMEYPLHFLGGLVLASAICSAFYASRAISSIEDVHARTIHMRLGLVVIVIYGLQVFLGLGVLL